MIEKVTDPSSFLCENDGTHCHLLAGYTCHSNYNYLQRMMTMFVFYTVNVEKATYSTAVHNVSARSC